MNGAKPVGVLRVGVVGRRSIPDSGQPERSLLERMLRIEGWMR